MPYPSLLFSDTKVLGRTQPNGSMSITTRWQACNLISNFILPHGHTSCHILIFLPMPFQSYIHNYMPRLKTLLINNNSFLPHSVYSFSAPFCQLRNDSQLLLTSINLQHQPVHHIAHFFFVEPSNMPLSTPKPLSSSSKWASLSIGLR